MKFKGTTSWYPFEEVGGFYRLEDGVLLGRPMYQDGRMGTEEEEFEVDWDRGISATESVNLINVGKKLQRVAEHMEEPSTTE